MGQDESGIVSKTIMDTVYGKLNGQKLRLPINPAHWPNKDVLAEHIAEFGLR